MNPLKPLQKPRLVNVAGILLVGIIGFCVSTPTVAQAYHIPEPVEEGNWIGSWALNSRDYQYGLFFEEDANGKLQAQVYYRSKQRADTFRTDWSGAVEYAYENLDANFELKFESVTDNLITGTWFWKTPTTYGQRTEEAKFEMYRINDGRSLAIHFKEFIRTDYREDRPPQARDLPMVWTFRKVSKRTVRSEELPF